MPASSKQKYSKTLAFPNAYYESFSNLGQSVELFCAYDYSSLDRDWSRNSRNKMRAHITCRMGRYRSAPLVTKGLTGSIKQSNLFIESPQISPKYYFQLLWYFNHIVYFRILTIIFCIFWYNFYAKWIPLYIFKLSN